MPCNRNGNKWDCQVSYKYISLRFLCDFCVFKYKILYDVFYDNKYYHYHITSSGSAYQTDQLMNICISNRPNISDIQEHIFHAMGDIWIHIKYSKKSTQHMLRALLYLCSAIEHLGSIAPRYCKVLYSNIVDTNSAYTCSKHAST